MRTQSFLTCLSLFVSASLLSVPATAQIPAKPVKTTPSAKEKLASSSRITPESLELSSDGVITLYLTNFGPVLVNTMVIDTSVGWSHVKTSTTKYDEQSGSKVERISTYTFPDGSEVTVNVQAEIIGSEVRVTLAWPTQSTAKGFIASSLEFSEDQANNFIIDMGGKQFFKGFEDKIRPGGVVQGDVRFSSPSDGADLFQISGEFSWVDTFYYTDRDSPQKGLTFRIFGEKANQSLISDPSNLTWTLSCP
jgi:hypothetical protein